jgi:hypothetical protein
MSEAMLRGQLGDEAVDAVQQEFRAAASKDETLWGKLYAQPHPVCLGLQAGAADAHGR